MAVLNLFKDGEAAAKQFRAEGHVVDGEPDVVWTDQPGFRLVFLKCKRCRFEYSWDTDTRAIIVNHEDINVFEDSFLHGCPGPIAPDLKLV